MDIKAAIAHAISGADMTRDQVAVVFDAIMAGIATPAQIGGLLVALRMKGESAQEIAGAALAMRQRARAFQCDDLAYAVDTCGTGGDGSGYVNISTIGAIVAAAAGVMVAKHGNRALSSKSGSADILEALGVKIEAPAEVSERCLNEIKIAFLFAPHYHAATKHAAGPRRELGTRTVFNLLGPLTNPAGVLYQVVGVYSAAWCAPLADALGQLGSKRAYVVHGDGGVDEIAVRGATRVAEWDSARGSVREFEITPADFGLSEGDPKDLAGADANFNASVARGVLDGDKTAVRTAVVMEAAAALEVVGLAADLREGAERAQMAIDRGDAKATLAKWCVLSNEV